jgi:TatD DNase family protein
MLVDSHCHLDHLDLIPDTETLEVVVNEAWSNEVKHILSVGLNLVQSGKVIEIASSFSHVSASVGVHPTDQPDESGHLYSITELEEKLIALGSHPKVVAIGETGLDFYRETEEKIKQIQRDKFRAHIRAAKKLKKPLIIHTRQAQNETLDIMAQEEAAQIGGVMHCFTESLAMAEACMAMNFYISFSGIVTFKNAVELQSLAQLIPPDKILIETDAPYLAPMPFRGKSNRPAYVKYVAEKIAQLRGETTEFIANCTTKNYFDLFYLSDRSVYVNVAKR